MTSMGRLLPERAVWITLVIAVAGFVAWDVWNATTHWYLDVFRDLMQREPTRAELAAELPVRNRDIAAMRVYMSDEHRSRVLEGYYRKYLERPMETAGRQFWLDELGVNRSYESIQTQILGSEEYY